MNSNNKNTNIKCRKYPLTKNFCQNFIENIYSEFELDFVFIKRAISKRDKYSGNIAFPGGRSEKKDQNILETAIRE